MNAYIADKDQIKKILKNDTYIFEAKLDGFRSLAYVYKDHIKFISRNDVDLTPRFSFGDFRKNVKAQTAVLDGEIVAFDPKGALNFHSLRKGYKVTFIVFDILEKDNQILTQLPLIERKKILKKTIKSGNGIKLIRETTNGPALWKAIKKINLEGIIAKEKDGLYYEGYRKHTWLKLKKLVTVDFVIVGYTKNVDGLSFASLCLGLYGRDGKLHFQGKVGTGFSNAYRHELYGKLQHVRTDKKPVIDQAPAGIYWVKPKLVCEVAFLESIKNKGINFLRHPSFERLRKPSDKKSRQCTITGQIPPKNRLDLD